MWLTILILKVWLNYLILNYDSSCRYLRSQLIEYTKLNFPYRWLFFIKKKVIFGNFFFGNFCFRFRFHFPEEKPMIETKKNKILSLGFFFISLALSTDNQTREWIMVFKEFIFDFLSFFPYCFPGTKHCLNDLYNISYQ